MITHIFIISWSGQHENAVFIAKRLLNLTQKVSIIYSDPDPEFTFDLPCNLIKRPNELFWGDKFKACLDACGEDPMLVIHADCTYSDWQHLAKTCLSTIHKYPMIGLWAPKIDFVPWTIKMVEVSKISNTSLSIVVRTDGIVFYLSPIIVKRMRRANYDQNVYGRGIELMFVATTYVRGMIAVIDNSIEVTHPKSTGYSEKDAHQQFLSFIKQFDAREEVQRILFRSHMMRHGARPLIPE